MKRVMALACAVEPLAFSAFFPPHVELPEALALDELVVVELLLLPQAASSRTPTVMTPTAAPDRLSFT
jgi:hypothetical protein